MNLCEFKASLVYRASYRTTGATQGNPVKQNKTKQNKTKQNAWGTPSILLGDGSVSIVLAMQA